MGRWVELGPTRETESREETLRVTAVETAWALIRRHPNWIRHYGFSVGEAWRSEFVDSLQNSRRSSRCGSSARARASSRPGGNRHCPTRSMQS